MNIVDSDGNQVINPDDLDQLKFKLVNDDEIFGSFESLSYVQACVDSSSNQVYIIAQGTFKHSFTIIYPDNDIDTVCF